MAEYGYARVSRPTQSIDRQIRNIIKAYPDAVIETEAWTGTTMLRPKWKELCRKVREGDLIVFDSVSRMSRDAEEGFKTYEEMFERGIDLIFLKEPHISTTTYRSVLQNQKIAMTGDKVDYIIEGINRYLMELAKEQIRLAFVQSEKEVKDLHQRTSEGMKTAKLKGKRIGLSKGAVLNVKKKAPAKERIIELSRYFRGSLTDRDVMKLVGLSPNTYYKYKKEIIVEMSKKI